MLTYVSVYFSCKLTFDSTTLTGINFCSPLKITGRGMSLTVDHPNIPFMLFSSIQLDES